MNRKLIVAMLLCSLVAFSGKLFADETAPTWQALDANQQAAFEILETNWDQLPVTYRLNLLRGLAKWSEMSDGELATAEKRYEKLQSMSDENRQSVQQQFNTFQKMPKAKKKALTERYKSFQKMPLEQRQRLVEEFKQEQRRANNKTGKAEQGQAARSAQTTPKAKEQSPEAQPGRQPARQEQPRPDRPNNNDRGGRDKGGDRQSK